MKKNMGSLDRFIRLFAAVAIVLAYFANWIGGLTAIILGVIALVFFITSLRSSCPLYSLLGVSTLSTE